MTQLGLSSVRLTSWLCLKEIEARGLLSHQRLTVYRALIEHGPMTGAELDQRLSGSRGHLHKRLPELARVGLVVEKPSRRCTVTGHLAIEWEAVDAMPTVPPRKSTRVEELAERLCAEFQAGIIWTGDEAVRLVKRVAGVEP